MYERLRSQTMQGTDPNGSPRSLGCIELPHAAAEQAWGYLTYGTLVTVL